MKPTEKNLLLDRLSVCYNRINYLKALCEEQGLIDEAVRLGRRKDRLKLEIDGLLRDLYQDWIGDASALRKRLDVSNKAIDAAVKDIEKKIKLAENIVKVLGYIDEGIEIAAGLVT
ncbi:MAG: hypothetical protein K9N62_02020 [Verrucomicrobia bacterium]|jgi:putative lipase involved disintegration of autophagic bodies|nr:hypothetical protein [Verrucomicrobiota bacterium]